MTKQTFIIAEVGVNHDGSVAKAKQLIDAAVAARADAVKFQSFQAAALVTKAAAKASYQQANQPDDKSQHDMLKGLELSFAQQLELASYAKSHAIEFISTAFDPHSMRFLAEQAEVKRFKIGSGDVTNLPLLWQHAQYTKPIILSTGMSNLAEIEMALSAIALGYCHPDDDVPTLMKCRAAYQSSMGKQLLQERVTLLHCTSAYPCAITDVNLRAMDTLVQRFELEVGYSDHTLGIMVPALAVAKGAVVLEKHLTLDKQAVGPDHKASLNAEAFKQMVQQVREVELVLGQSAKTPTANEEETKQVARRSIVASATIQAGDAFTAANLSLLRPGTGLSPSLYWQLLTQTASKAYQPGDLIEEAL